jgi:hypothetical protein
MLRMLRNTNWRSCLKLITPKPKAVRLAGVSLGSFIPRFTWTKARACFRLHLRTQDKKTQSQPAGKEGGLRLAPLLPE